MSYESKIEASDNFFAGEDRTLSYEILADDGTSMEDVSTFTLEWTLRKDVAAKHPYRVQGSVVLTKTSALGISVTGTYDSVRATNTQRVIVTIADTDTEAFAGGRYVAALKRMDAGLESVLSHGVVEVLVSPVR